MGCQGQNRQRILCADIVDQHVKILLGYRLHQCRRVLGIENPRQGPLGRNREQLPPFVVDGGDFGIGRVH